MLRLRTVRTTLLRRSGGQTAMRPGQKNDEDVPIRVVDGVASLAGSVPFHRRHAMLVLPFPSMGVWPRVLEVRARDCSWVGWLGQVR